MLPTDLELKRRAWFPILIVGLSMVGFITIKASRDALFFDDGGLSSLPSAYMCIAAVSLPAAMMHLSAMNRWGTRRVRTAVFGLTSMILLGFTPLLEGPGASSAAAVLFVLVPTLFGALFAGAWLLAGDLLECGSAALKRWAYSRIGAASMVGGIAGGLLTRGLSGVASPSSLLIVGCCVIAGVGFVVSYAHRRYPLPPVSGLQRSTTTTTARLREHVGLLRQPYIGTLLGISGLAAVAALYIDFQFYAGATLTGRNNVNYFAEFYIYLNLASLAIQLLVAPRLQARFGVAGALLTLPAALLGAGGVLSLGLTVHTRAVLRVAEGGLKASVYRSVWEQAFLPIARDARPVAKVYVDGLAARMAEGAGAAALFVWLGAGGDLTLESLAWVWWVVVIVLGLWFVLTRRLRDISPPTEAGQDPEVRLSDGCPCAAALGADKPR